jgi:peptide deformylase
MAIRNILTNQDPMLKKKSRLITEFNERLHLLLDDMRHTLIQANGLGLAAPQVGVLRRVMLVVDSDIESEDLNEKIIELVNPSIIKKDGEHSDSEGCLSVPGLRGIIKRPEIIWIKASDRYGKEFKFCGKEITARAICHELDHLNGVWITDIAERLFRDEVEE